MAFHVLFASGAAAQLRALAVGFPDKHTKVQKTLGFLETNPRHPGLHTHKYDGYSGPNKEQVFEAYVENKTPGAYRVFFYYPAVAAQKPPKGKPIKPVKHTPTIMVLAITPHS